MHATSSNGEVMDPRDRILKAIANHCAMRWGLDEPLNNEAAQRREDLLGCIAKLVAPWAEKVDVM